MTATVWVIWYGYKEYCDSTFIRGWQFSWFNENSFLRGLFNSWFHTWFKIIIWTFCISSCIILRVFLINHEIHENRYPTNNKTFTVVCCSGCNVPLFTGLSTIISINNRCCFHCCNRGFLKLRYCLIVST